VFRAEGRGGAGYRYIRPKGVPRTSRLRSVYGRSALRAKGPSSARRSLAPLRDPYRDEYMAALLGWIPSSLLQQIRAACPEYSGYSACSDLHLDDEAVRRIVERIDPRQAQLVFQTRELRLGTLRGIGRRTLAVLDQALALLKR
jgi:hypothetical protein